MHHGSTAVALHEWGGVCSLALLCTVHQDAATCKHEASIDTIGVPVYSFGVRYFSSQSLHAAFLKVCGELTRE